MVGSVLNEGLRGMQNSQRELQKAASEIASANIRERPEETTSPEVPTTLQPVDESPESTRSQRTIEESLIELRRQEQLFTANAKVVSVAEETLGSIIDVKS
ncbi:MAG: hypothetical protein K6L76_08570 [Agarilytica sp.]